MPRHLATPITLLALVLAVCGCSPRQTSVQASVAEDLDRLQRDLELLPPFPEPSAQSGSLWTAGGPGAALIRDTRAFRVNDLLTITLQEATIGANESNTDLSRATDINYSAPFVFGLDKPQILETSTESDFSGDGRTTRRSSLIGSITARVARVLPNGDLVIAGQKTVMVNREKQILTLIGSVRPVDISAQNRVGSTAVGDLTVRMWGNGEVDDTTRQGWFMRIMNRIWPF